jgi:hypothetical protein
VSQHGDDGVSNMAADTCGRHESMIMGEQSEQMPQMKSTF